MKNMVLLIDVNLILTYITKRQPGFDEAYRIMNYLTKDNICGYMAFHTISIIWYVLRKKTVIERRKILLDLCDILTVTGASHQDVLEAIKRDDFADFEDCLQEECAKNVEADYIVTENIKDFKTSKIPAVSPKELLNILDR